jgi:tRNA pseudouridine55 synthase
MISPPPDGFLLLNKKTNITSFNSLAAVKKTFSTGKAGHTGTLDKFASGLLLVLVGRGVKLSSIFANCAKEYTGTIFFGAETDTLDPEGKIIGEGKIPSRKEVEDALDNFRGGILQSPPTYSAMHINGKRAYQLAREGKEPEMKKRPVTVFELELLSYTPPEAAIRARVSAGTYIRSLARDIALAAGSRAHLTALGRTKVGPFHLEDTAEEDGENLANALRPLDRVLFNALSLPIFLIDERAASGFVHGRPLETLLEKGDFCLSPGAGLGFAGVFKKSAPDELLGVLKHLGGEWNYGHVF